MKSYPTLPVENVVVNPGFEARVEGGPSAGLAGWCDWPEKSAWRTFLYPDGAVQDREDARFGAACVRIGNTRDEKPQKLVQVIPAKEYTYKTPSVSIGGIDESAGPGIEDLLEDLPQEFAEPTHLFSCWGRTDGRVKGRIELHSVSGGSDTELIVEKEFDNTEWEKLEIPFKPPEKGSALMIVLSPAVVEPEGASVWFDNVSLMPVKATLEYEVDIPAFSKLVVSDKASGDVIEKSEKRAGSVAVPAEGVYVLEAHNRKGETVSMQYPSAMFADAENIIDNGGFEQGPEALSSWKHYSWGNLKQTAKVSVDTNEVEAGSQSMSFFAAWNRDAIKFNIAAGRFLPDHRYVFSFWAKTRATGCYFINLTGDKTRLVDTRLWGPTNWRYYRFPFTTPERAGVDLVISVTGWKEIRSESMLWLDEVSLRPLSQAEINASDLINGIDTDMSQFSSAVVRERLYELENQIDITGFDIDDLLSLDVIDETAYRKLTERVEALEGDWRKARDELYGYKNALTERGEDIIADRNWDRMEAFSAEARDWRKTYRKMMDNLLNPVEEGVVALRNEIKDKLDKLATLKKKRELDIAAREREETAVDYKKAFEAISSPDPAEREKGALELGRIQDDRAANALIGLLDDENYPVRRNALYALAWMRSKDAVPEILALVESSQDPWTRRRATQALGMIGDMRASPVLKELVNDRDGTVRQNAIISLGWLGDRSAVPVLTNIVSQVLGYSPATFEWIIKERSSEGMPTNTVSEGAELPTLDNVGREDDGIEIDAESAVDMLEEKPAEGEMEAGESESMPAMAMDGRWQYGRALNNSYLTAELAVMSLGFIGDPETRPFLGNLVDKHGWTIRSAAMFALGRIGNKADEALLEKYANYQTCMHRVRRYLRWHGENALGLLRRKKEKREPGIEQPDFMKQKRYFYWLDNHFHRAFGRWFSEKNRPFDDFEGAMRYMNAADATEIFEWTVPVPAPEGRRYFETAGENGLRCMVGEIAEAGKGYVVRKVCYFGQYPAFAGIWQEEGPSMFLDDMRERTKHLDPELLKYVEPGGRVDPEIRWKHREFYAKHALAVEQNVLDALQEHREFLHMLRKGSLNGHYTSICSSTFTPWPTIALWGRMAHHLDIPGTEPSYSTATYENSMFAEMCRDGDDDICAGMEIYIWRLPWNFTRRWEIGMCISLLHAQQFYVWYWGDIFKQFNSAGRGRPEAWDITMRTFSKMKKLEPYLVHNKRPKDLALVYSGRTSSLLYRDDATDRDRTQYYVQNLYTRNCIGVFQALAYGHTQCDVIWADTMTQESVEEYRTLLISDAKTLTPDEENILREWVRNGGSLIATGTTTLFDQYGNARKNYGLADVFGVDFKESTCTIPLENIDTGKGGAEAKMDEFTIDTHAMEYNVSMGYDKVAPTTAEIVTTWKENGDAAVTLNKFGKGHCLFLTAAYPGMMYRGGRMIYRWPLVKYFKKGVVETLSGLCRRALTLTGTRQPVFVENCPDHVEVNLRLQPGKNRMLFQLLNYDEQELPVSGVKAKVRVPAEVKKVYYGADDRKIEYTQADGYVEFSIGDFDIHEAIVIEW